MGNKRKVPSAAEKQLLAQFARLSESQRETLQAFADFLVNQASALPAISEPPAEPLDIPRPEKESVIAAIKRLNISYAMLEDRAGLLNETSLLMTQHVMQGRDLREVIDDLEALFSRFYTEWRVEQDS